MTGKTLRSRAYYIDTFAQNSTHEMVNSSLIIMCSMVFENVKCNISRSSYLDFENIIDTDLPSNILFNYVWVVKGTNRFSLLMRYFFSAFQNVLQLIKSPVDAVIIFPFNNLFSLRLINTLNKILKRKIIIFCHSEMEGINIDLKDVGFLHKTLAKLCRNFFLNPKVKISKGLYFSVMGDVLKENLGKIISGDKIAKFISIDHPYIFKNHSTCKNRKGSSLQIGTVGTLNKLKGLDKLVDFVSNISPSIGKRLKLSVVGVVSGDTTLLNSLNIEMLPGNQSLSRNDFNKRVQELDVILFFYSQDSYRITASGAIIDAILHEKPILALKNDYFAYIFNKFGNFGYLLNNTNEMNDKLNSMLEGNLITDIDFAGLKAQFTPAKLSLQLEAELMKMGYINL